MSDATAAYSNLAVDVAQEMMGGTYDMDDYRRHGLWLWTNLARDWSRAWMGTLEVVDQMSRLERGDPSGRAVPLAPPKTVVIVGPVGADTDVAVTDLSGIGGNRHTIPSATLTVSPKVLAPGSTVTISGADGTEVTVTAGITDAPPGLYVGGLHAGASTEPVLLYVSDAVGPAGEAVG
jgi:hypothetical protein